MENKELLTLLKEFINSETLANKVESIVREEVDHIFEYTLRKQVEEKAREVSNLLVSDAIELVMNGQVRIDDGWGNTQEYGTFEELVKKKIANNINNQWNIQTQINKLVDERIKKICEQVKEENINNLADIALLKLKGELNT